MTTEKFETEINTLKTFYELYCKDKHQNLVQRVENLEYKDAKFRLELNLCQDCYNIIKYSIDKLEVCPHEIKPRCRSCPSPCYEKDKWKETARVMKYSAIKLSLGKIKSRVMNMFGSTKQ